jgi:hypothetical protein
LPRSCNDGIVTLLTDLNPHFYGNNKKGKIAFCFVIFLDCFAAFPMTERVKNYFILRIDFIAKSKIKKHSLSKFNQIIAENKNRIAFKI